jgi:hypothetical protein
MLGGESKHRLYHAPNAHRDIIDCEGSVRMECSKCDDVEFSAHYDMSVICKPDGSNCSMCSEVKTTFMCVTVHLSNDDGADDESDSEDYCVDCMIKALQEAKEDVETSMRDQRREWANIMYGREGQLQRYN